MLVINNKQEFESFYPYSKDQIKKYPKEYPCICSWSIEGGGLMGDYKQVHVIYFPNHSILHRSIFIAGLNAKWQDL
jgi:hypothetical protein